MSEETKKTGFAVVEAETGPLLTQKMEMLSLKGYKPVGGVAVSILTPQPTQARLYSQLMTSGEGN